MVATVISAFLYLRVIVSMYMQDRPGAGDEPRRIPVPLAAGLGLAVAALVTVVAGIFPGTLSEPAGDAAPALVAEAPAEAPQAAAP